MAIEPPLPNHDCPHAWRIDGRLAPLQVMVAHEFVGDPLTKDSHEVGLHEDRCRREIGRLECNVPHETALGEPVVDEAGVLVTRRDLEMGQCREGGRRQRTPDGGVAASHDDDE